MSKIPTTIITGFLGAGKTTLVRHLLTHASGKRIALIVNEFGDIGVDGDLLSGCLDPACAADDMIELANGCICCTVADDFIPAMTQLLERDQPPEHIVIETSGLALPQPLVRAFNWPEIRARVTVDGVVAVVDGGAWRDGLFSHDETALGEQRAADDSLDHETPISELFEDQLACADLIILNKTDLLDGAAAMDAAKALKAKARQASAVIPAKSGAVDPAILLGLGVGAEDHMQARGEIHHHHHDEDDDHDHAHEHGHDEFESFALTLPEAQSLDALKSAVDAVMRDFGILRLKGFAAIQGKPMRLIVQAVGPRIETYFDRPFRSDEACETRLVVIAEAGVKAHETAIARALQGETALAASA